MAIEKNTSYIFIPFSIFGRSAFNPLICDLEKSDKWELKQDKMKYMFKYITDKMNSKDRDSCQIFHFDLKSEYIKEFGGAKNTFYTDKHIFNGKEINFAFHIVSVALYCFSTSICILAVRITFDNDHPMYISNAEYYIKKVSRERITFNNNNFTLLEFSQKLMKEYCEPYNITFFFYANPTTERSNMLTFAYSSSDDQLNKELYYLRKCYNNGFVYKENEDRDKKDIFSLTDDVHWGVSSEAVICLVSANPENPDFIENTFYYNFNAQYLFMYVLLLHQKYVLYMFLTKIGLGINNNLKMLENYKRDLYEFETDFVFSCISEVPQYQQLYEIISDKFALERKYRDVREPLLSLSELRIKENEKIQDKQSSIVNSALLILSLLTSISVLADGYTCVENYFGCLGDSKVFYLQCVWGIILAIVMVYFIVKIVKSKKSMDKEKCKIRKG